MGANTVGFISVAHGGNAGGIGGPFVTVANAFDPTTATEAGVVYLTKASGASTIDLSTSTATIYGAGAADQFGFSVVSGDVKGDGTDDLLIGAPMTYFPRPGAAFLFYGPVQGTLTANDADVTFVSEMIADKAGRSVALISDVTGDGRPEVAVGAPRSGMVNYSPDISRDSLARPCRFLSCRCFVPVRRGGVVVLRRTKRNGGKRRQGA